MILQRTFIFTMLLGALFFNSQAQNDKKINETYDNLTAVHIKGSFCTVTAEGVDGTTLSIKGEISGSGSDNYSINYHVENGKLEVEVKSHKKNKWGWNNSLRGNIDVKVPKSVAVMIHNSSGNIYAKKLESSQEIELRASSGNIDAQQVTAALHVTASSGNIDLEQITGATKIKTSSGNQRVNQITGNVTSVASSGNTRFSDITGNLDALTSSGDIQLSNTKGACKLKASSGDIRGKGIHLEDHANIRTTSGSVNLDFANDMKELSFELTASSGNLRVAGEKSDRKLLLKQGSIQVKGVSSSGSQTYN